MSTWQEWSALGAVAVAAAYLAWRGYRAWFRRRGLTCGKCAGRQKGWVAPNAVNGFAVTRPSDTGKAGIFGSE